MPPTGLQLLLRPAPPRQGNDWLSALFEAVCLDLADTFQNELGVRIGVRFDALSQAMFSTILPRVTDCTIGASLRIADARERAFFFIEAPAIFDIVETSFGGDGSEPPYREERAFTSLEKQIGRYVVEKVISALENIAAENVAPSIGIDRLETRTESLAVPHYDRGAIATFALVIFHRESNFHILVPEELMAPLRACYGVLAKNQEEKDSERDWTRRLEMEVMQAELPLRIVLKEDGYTLGDVARFTEGKTLALRATPKTPVMLEAEGFEIFSCQLGQADGRYTVRIEDEV